MNEISRVIQKKIAAIIHDDVHDVDLEHLSRGLQMVYATRDLETEVRRAGFESYLSRAGGHLAAKAIKGYELIGAECHAALVEDALAVFDRRSPSSITYAVLDDVFRDLDPPGPLKLEYIREYPEDFVKQ